MRLYVRLEDLQPMPDGRLPRVRLQMPTRDLGVSHELSIPDSVIRSAWQQAMAYRVFAAGKRAEVPMRLALPMPHNAALKKAHELNAAGELIAAAAAAEQQLWTARGRDGLFARVVVAQALASHGDSIAARVLLAEALRGEPCLGLDKGVDAGFRAAIAPLRPNARCEAMSPARVVVSGLAAPGNGQRIERRVFPEMLFLAATLASAGTSVAQWLGSRSDYSSYKTASTTPDALRFYQSASDRQLSARRWAATAAIVWICGSIEAGIAEWRHGRRLRDIRRYGAP